MTHPESIDPQMSRAARAPMTALQPPAEMTSNGAPAPGEPVSFKVEVLTFGSINWTANDFRLATQTEAEAYGRHLKDTWTDVRQWRVRPTALPANAVFANGRLTIRSS